MATFSPSEAERLAATQSHCIFDIAPREDFEDVVRLAAHICDVPIAAVSLVGEHHQWFKSILGSSLTETPRDVAFCAHTVLQSEVMVVPDAQNDPRFADNPLVTGDPHIRFYAGAPLVTSDGAALGALCVIDHVPKQLAARQAEALELLARQVARRIDLGQQVANQERLIAEIKQRDEVLQHSEAQFRRIIDVSPMPYCLNDGHQNITFLNAEFVQTFGYTREDIPTLAEWWPRAYPDPVYRQWVAATWQARLEKSEREGTPFEALEVDVRCKDGTLRTVIASATALGESFARVHLVSLYDLSARKKAEEALRQSEARLDEAQRLAQIGSWEYDIQADRIAWSDELFRLFEMDPAGGAPSVEALMTHYHPEDVAEHATITEQAMRDGLPYEFDIRIVRRDGSIRWAHAVGRGEREATGRVGRLFGTIMDITERKLAEERFRVLFEQSSHAHLLFEEEGGIIDCNAATLSVMRCADKAQLLGTHPALLSPEYQPDGRRSEEKGAEMCLLARRSGSHRFEWRRRTVDGHEFPVEVSLTSVILAGKPVLLSVWHDLTERLQAEERVRDHAIVLEFQKRELEKANAELGALATTDGLTGLRNHRAFQERMVRELERATCEEAPLSLVLLDVDHFKRYNDTHGHPAGDGVLKAVARILQESIRDKDLAARYGGEEFVLILPQTGLEGAAAFAERLRESVESYPWPVQPVTASFGVTELHVGSEDGAGMLARADAALYRSKAAGRNRVACAPNLTTLPDCRLGVATS